MIPNLSLRSGTNSLRLVQDALVIFYIPHTLSGVNSQSKGTKGSDLSLHSFPGYRKWIRESQEMHVGGVTGQKVCLPVLSTSLPMNLSDRPQLRV